MTTPFDVARRRRWYVTLRGAACEITVEVSGVTKTDARRNAKALHPHWRVLTIEHAKGTP